jgi:hypothetical protein
MRSASRTGPRIQDGAIAKTPPGQGGVRDAANRPRQELAMKLFMFKSESKSGLHAFTAEPSGGQLPSPYQPWTAVGVVKPDSDPPHGLSRQAIELSIQEHGFQLWRVNSLSGRVRS